MLTHIEERLCRRLYRLNNIKTLLNKAESLKIPIHDSQYVTEILVDDSLFWCNVI